jgi:hypothetical protein
MVSGLLVREAHYVIAALIDSVVMCVLRERE